MVTAAPDRVSAFLLGATAADVLWSLGVFLGVPACIFVVVVWREWRRIVSETRQWRIDAKGVSEEGYPPGPPVGSPEASPGTTKQAKGPPSGAARDVPPVPAPGP